MTVDERRRAKPAKLIVLADLLLGEFGTPVVLYEQGDVPDLD